MITDVRYEPNSRHVLEDNMTEVHASNFWRDDYHYVAGRHTVCGDIILTASAKMCYTDYHVQVVSPKGYDGWWQGAVWHLDARDDEAPLYASRWHDDPRHVATLIDRFLDRRSKRILKRWEQESM